MIKQMERRFMSSALNIFTFALAFLFCFPVLWMLMTSFKNEVDAFASPPQFIFQPTLDNWQNALQSSPYLTYLINTLVITTFSTLAAVALGLPAAYTLAYYP